MKKINGLIAGSLLIVSGSSFAAEQFCLSTDSLPTHCKAGDIILIGPKEVPLACDFSKQIIQMSQKEGAPEYVCYFTGKVLKIKKGPVKAPPPQKPANYAPPPPRKSNKSMFDSMPFMK